MPSCIYLWLEGGSEIRYTHGLRPWLTQSDHVHTEHAHTDRAIMPTQSNAHTDRAIMRTQSSAHTNRVIIPTQSNAFWEIWNSRRSHRAFSMHGAEALTQSLALKQRWGAHTELRCSHRDEVLTQSFKHTQSWGAHTELCADTNLRRSHRD